MNTKDMSVADLRRANIVRLADEKFDGVLGTLADRVGRKRSNLYALISGARPFGEKLARSIEITLGLDPGWLDQDHADADGETVRAIPNPSYSPAISEKEMNHLSAWRRLSPQQQEKVTALIDMILGSKKRTRGTADPVG